MPQPFNNAIITNAGAMLLTRAQAGEIKIEFTRIAIGNGEYSAEEKILEVLQRQTDLKSLKNSYTISSIEVFSEHCVKVTALITNQDPVTGQTLVNDGYYINEMGLFAKVKDGADDTEVLYSITTTSGNKGDFMPPYNGYNLAQIIQEYFATVNNSAEISIVSTGAVALSEDLNKIRDIVDKLKPIIAPSYTVPNELEALENGEDLKKAMGKIARAVSLLASHLNNIDNPHKVTKLQVGLGNCNDTSDIDKPVSEAQRTAIDEAYMQSTEYTNQAIANLINGAPETMDTLKEIADAMEENQDVVEALNAAIGNKADKQEFHAAMQRLGKVCKLLEHGDWDNIKENGFYMSQHMEHAPIEGWLYGIVIAHNDKHVRQILYRFGSANNDISNSKHDRYERACSNGTWGAWENTSLRLYQKKDTVEGCIFGTLEMGELQEILEDSLCFTGNDVLGSSITTKLETNGNAESYTLKWTVGTNRVQISDLSGTVLEVPVICMYKYNMYCYDVREVLKHMVGEKISSIRVQSGAPVHVEVLTNARGEIVNLIRKIGHTPLGIGDGNLTEAIEYLRNTALTKTGGTVNGLTEFQQGTIAYEYIHSTGTGGFLKLATFKITGDGLEFPIEFHLSELEYAGDICVRFIKNEVMTEYNVGEFTYSGNIAQLNPHIHKSATDTWDLYVWIRAWSAISVSGLRLNKYMIQRLNNGHGIIWHYGPSNVFDALPTNVFKAKKKYIESNKIMDRSNVLDREKYMSFAAESENYNGARLLLIGSKGRSDYLFTHDETATNFYGVRNLTPGTANLGTPTYKWANIYAETGAITTSDKTEKKDIADLDEARTIDFIMGLKTKSFKFINGSSGRTHHGLISDEVEELLAKLGMSTLDFAGFIKSPKTRIVEKDGELIEEIIEGEYTRGLRYEEFISDIIKMLQIIWKKNIAQEKINAELESEISNIKQELEELKNKVR